MCEGQSWLPVIFYRTVSARRWNVQQVFGDECKNRQLRIHLNECVSTGWQPGGRRLSSVVCNDRNTAGLGHSHTTSLMLLSHTCSGNLYFLHDFLRKIFPVQVSGTVLLHTSLYKVRTNLHQNLTQKTCTSYLYKFHECVSGGTSHINCLSGLCLLPPVVPRKTESIFQ